MKKKIIASIFPVLILFSGFLTVQFTYAKDIPGSGSSTETLVFFRHAEKPETEMGGINCQGLNRSLNLPQVLISKYGEPSFIFAPNPMQKVTGTSGSFYYLRPLATIEPLAIQLELPINLSFGFRDTEGLANELLKSKYANYTIFIAWEHNKLVDIVRDIYLKGGDGNDSEEIPEWKKSDFDSIYILNITRDLITANIQKILFSKSSEGLDGMSTTCTTAFVQKGK